MMDLASLLTVNGVIAALRFQDDGALMEAVGELTQIHSDLAAELCYANGRISHLNSDLLTTISGKPGWAPQGWMMIGSELSICTIANVACFIQNNHTDLNSTLNKLSELSSL